MKGTSRGVITDRYDLSDRSTPEASSDDGDHEQPTASGSYQQLQSDCAHLKKQYDERVQRCVELREEAELNRRKAEKFDLLEADFAAHLYRLCFDRWRGRLQRRAAYGRRERPSDEQEDDDEQHEPSSIPVEELESAVEESFAKLKEVRTEKDVLEKEVEAPLVAALVWDCNASLRAALEVLNADQHRVRTVDETIAALKQSHEQEKQAILEQHHDNVRQLQEAVEKCESEKAEKEEAFLARIRLLEAGARDVVESAWKDANTHVDNCATRMVEIEEAKAKALCEAEDRNRAMQLEIGRIVAEMGTKIRDLEAEKRGLIGEVGEWVRGVAKAVALPASGAPDESSGAGAGCAAETESEDATVTAVEVSRTESAGNGEVVVPVSGPPGASGAEDEVVEPEAEQGAGTATDNDNDNAPDSDMHRILAEIRDAIGIANDEGRSASDAQRLAVLLEEKESFDLQLERAEECLIEVQAACRRNILAIEEQCAKEVAELRQSTVGQVPKHEFEQRITDHEKDCVERILEAQTEANRRLQELGREMRRKEEDVVALCEDVSKVLKYMMETNVEASGGPKPVLRRQDILPEDVFEHLGLSAVGVRIHDALLGGVKQASAELFAKAEAESGFSSSSAIETATSYPVALASATRKLGRWLLPRGFGGTEDNTEDVAAGVRLNFQQEALEKSSSTEDQTQSVHVPFSSCESEDANWSGRSAPPDDSVATVFLTDAVKALSKQLAEQQQRPMPEQNSETVPLVAALRAYESLQDEWQQVAKNIASGCAYEFPCGWTLADVHAVRGTVSLRKVLRRTMTMSTSSTSAGRNLRPLALSFLMQPCIGDERELLDFDPEWTLQLLDGEDASSSLVCGSRAALDDEIARWRDANGNTLFQLVEYSRKVFQLTTGRGDAAVEARLPTLAGVEVYLKSEFPELSRVVVAPNAAATAGGGPAQAHYLQFTADLLSTSSSNRPRRDAAGKTTNVSDTKVSILPPVESNPALQEAALLSVTELDRGVRTLAGVQYGTELNVENKISVSRHEALLLITCERVVLLEVLAAAAASKSGSRLVGASRSYGSCAEAAATDFRVLLDLPHRDVDRLLFFCSEPGTTETDHALCLLKRAGTSETETDVLLTVDLDEHNSMLIDKEEAPSYCHQMTGARVQFRVAKPVAPKSKSEGVADEKTSLMVSKLRVEDLEAFPEAEQDAELEEAFENKSPRKNVHFSFFADVSDAAGFVAGMHHPENEKLLDGVSTLAEGFLSQMPLSSGTSEAGRDDAALKLQSVQRGKSDRNRVAEIKQQKQVEKENAAATKIQSQARAKQAKTRVEQLRAETDPSRQEQEERDAAATKIQRKARSRQEQAQARVVVEERRREKRLQDLGSLMKTAFNPISLFGTLFRSRSRFSKSRTAQNEAATVVQTGWRQRQARMDVQAKREDNAAAQIQSVVKRYLAQREAQGITSGSAATSIQAGWRQKQARRTVSDRRTSFVTAVMKMQRVFRGRRTRESLRGQLEAEVQDIAATRIQSGWRAKADRDRVSQMRAMTFSGSEFWVELDSHDGHPIPRHPGLREMVDVDEFGNPLPDDTFSRQNFTPYDTKTLTWLFPEEEKMGVRLLVDYNGEEHLYQEYDMLGKYAEKWSVVLSREEEERRKAEEVTVAGRFRRFVRMLLAEKEPEKEGEKAAGEGEAEAEENRKKKEAEAADAAAALASAPERKPRVRRPRRRAEGEGDATAVRFSTVTPAERSAGIDADDTLCTITVNPKKADEPAVEIAPEPIGGRTGLIMYFVLRMQYRFRKRLQRRREASVVIQQSYRKLVQDRDNSRFCGRCCWKKNRCCFWCCSPLSECAECCGVCDKVAWRVEEDEHGNQVTTFARKELLGHTATPVTDGLRILPQSREERMRKDKRIREAKVKAGKKLITDRVFLEVDWGKVKEARTAAVLGDEK
eukprot:g958.t1